MFCKLLTLPKGILEAYCRFFLGEDKLTMAETFYVADSRLKKSTFKQKTLDSFYS